MGSIPTAPAINNKGFKVNLYLEKLSIGERFVVEWQYEMLGGFKSQLASLIGKADSGNRYKLRLAFPEEVDAITSFYNVDGWWQDVEAKLHNGK